VSGNDVRLLGPRAARAARGPSRRTSFPLTGFQLGAIAVLVALIVLVFYLRS